MTSFTFYCTYMQLKTEQLMYSTDSSSTEWLRFLFSSTGVLYSSLKKQPQEMMRDSSCRAPEFQANRTCCCLV